MCVAWLIQICDAPHSYAWHASFMWVTCLIHTGTFEWGMWHMWLFFSPFFFSPFFFFFFPFAHFASSNRNIPERDSQDGDFPATQERKKYSDQIRDLFLDSYKITVLWIKYMYTHSKVHHWWLTNPGCRKDRQTIHDKSMIKFVTFRRYSSWQIHSSSPTDLRVSHTGRN